MPYGSARGSSRVERARGDLEPLSDRIGRCTLDLLHERAAAGSFALASSPVPCDHRAVPSSTATDRKVTKLDWTRDEAILLLDLYAQLSSAAWRGDNTAVVAESEFLNHHRTRLHGDRTFRADHRNPSGVAMELRLCAGLDPNAAGGGMKNVSRTLRAAWAEFEADPQRRASTARAIRGLLGEGSSPDPAEISGDPEEDEFPEGRLLFGEHRRRERSGSLVRRAKLNAGGSPRCAVCRFDFATTYGDVGEGFIEAHHTRPVSELIAGEKTRLKDIALVCSNCHSMLHRRRPWLGPSELAQLLGPRA